MTDFSENRNKVVLVDQQDTPIQEMDKMEAHRQGLLHRAISVFLFNSKGEMLIHQRADSKYHGGGLWTNACCSHPQFGEDVGESARTRLKYEMGLDCRLEKVFSFVYRADVENGLIEYEYDHVFIGYTDVIPQPNPAEVKNYRWVDPHLLKEDISRVPENYTTWFRIVLDKVVAEVA